MASAAVTNSGGNENIITESNVHADVKEYYGQRLRSQADLKSDVCKVTKSEKVATHVRQALAEVYEEVASRFYGCGITIPSHVIGCKILDLGSGSGLDCFAAAKLVGETGFVTGIDMTDEQLEIANKYIEYHQEKYKYEKANTEFVKGYLEDMKAAGIQSDYYDIVMSNCVVNLTADKGKVLKEAFRVLKPGGELYFSDIYADRPVAAELQKNKVLWGECISGALYWKDLLLHAQEAGFCTPRIVSAAVTSVGDNLKDLTGDIQFASVTYRLFKPAEQHAACTAAYRGTILGLEDEFIFDHVSKFRKGEFVQLDSDLASIIKSSRYCEVFDFGDSSDQNTVEVSSPEVDPFSLVDSSKVPAACCGVKNACCDSEGKKAKKQCC